MLKITPTSPYCAQVIENQELKEYSVVSSEFVRVNPGEIKEITLGFSIEKPNEYFIYPYFAHDAAKKGVFLLSHTLNQENESIILVANLAPNDPPTSVFSSIFGPMNKWECKKGEVLFKFKILEVVNNLNNPYNVHPELKEECEEINKKNERKI